LVTVAAAVRRLQRSPAMITSDNSIMGWASAGQRSSDRLGDGQQGAFQSAMDSALESRAGKADAKAKTPEERQREMDEADAATREAFLGYMHKTPMQRMREAILDELGLTEEQLAAMPADKRQAIEATIAERIKLRLHLASPQGTTPESQAAVSAVSVSPGGGSGLPFQG
jgi:hypothetical protein